MAKAKTSSSKKSAIKSKTVSARSASASPEVSRKITLSELKKRVTDPKNRKSLIIALGIVLLAVALYFGRGLFIAATVNGQPVSRLAVITELEKQSGEAVLDNMITRILVAQEAKENNVEVTSEEIEEEVNRIKNQFKEQGQDLDALLTAQGLSQEKFRDEVRIQLLVTKILGDQAKVSDDEFNEFLSNNQGLIAEDENEATARANLKTQLEQQKLAQKYQEWIQKVKKEASIQHFVNY
jgi:hypothetical protein